MFYNAIAQLTALINIVWHRATVILALQLDLILELGRQYYQESGSQI